MTSNVLVRDGHTIVIGGLFRERTTNGRSQVPLLGNIPCLGTAFRSTNDTTVREEVIILITPHIIQQDSGRGRQRADQGRRGALPHRAAQGPAVVGPRAAWPRLHMRWARQAIAEGKTDKALWNLDMALSLEPR